MFRTLRMRIQSESGVWLEEGKSPLRIRKCCRIINRIEQMNAPLMKCVSQTLTQEMTKTKGNRQLLAHSLRLCLFLSLPLQIPIELSKPRPSLTSHPKPRKRPRHQTTELLSMSESRPAGRDGTGLEAEEMVAVEEEGYASAPFELGGGVFL